MISQEFKSAVSDNNLLRTRIMIKDSFVIDPTFTQLDGMLSYARSHLPNLFVPFDGECLENDEIKWNNDVMNRELVQLVNNFSEVRIVHLKKVVSKVLAAEANKIETKKDARQKALRVLRKEGDKIQKIMLEVTSQRSWNLGNINDMERAAKEILKAAQEYKNNK